MNPFGNINDNLVVRTIGKKSPKPRIKSAKPVGLIKRICPLNCPTHIKGFINNRKNYTTITVDVEFRSNLKLLESAFAFSKETHKYYQRTLKMNFMEFKTGRDKVYLTWKHVDKPYYIYAWISFKPSSLREVAIIEEYDNTENLAPDAIVDADMDYILTNVVFIQLTAREAFEPLVEETDEPQLSITV